MRALSNPPKTRSAAAHMIARMIQRNEKALLGPALAQWGTQYAQDDPDPRQTAEMWFKAACHKHGLGVLPILVQAGVALRSLAPVSDALERGFSDLAFAMAALLPTLPPLNPSRRKNTHILVEAARLGRVDVLDGLFDRLDTPEGSTDAPGQRANDLLMALCRQEGGRMAADMRPVVAFLLAKGGCVDYANPEGLSLLERSPLSYFAAGAANVPMLLALEAHGADLRLEQTAQSYMPHPFANAQQPLINTIRDSYYKHRKILPEQWETLRFLAERGVVLDPEGEQALMKSIPGNIPPWERAQVMEIVHVARAAREKEALEQATATVEGRAHKPRL